MVHLKASYTTTTTMFVEINSRRIPLDVGHLYLLGRRINALPNENDKQFIQLEDKDDVDQKHCIIEVGRHHSEDVYIYDLFSSQGTLLNNQPLKSLNKMRLKNGDIIKAGSQEIKFFKEQQEEVSHDSSGFLDVNRNTSDIVNSSHESTPRRNKCLENNNFLIPAIPIRSSSVTPNASGFIAETEVNNTKNSLNISFSPNNRRSDSFTIPETQYCQPRTSINSSDLSIAESIPEAKASNIKFNFGNLDDDDDDDFCIPETQEPIQIANSQRPRILADEEKPQDQKVVEYKTVELEAEENTKDIEGSQFRICTQEYNDGFGEEMNTLHSQIIPLIKHNKVVLNESSQSMKDSSKSQSQFERRNKRDDKEQSSLSIKWSASKGEQETTSLRADCSTPDIFNLNDMEQSTEEVSKASEETKTKVLDVLEEDEDDLLPTQFFSLQTTKPCEKIMSNDTDKPCVEKENVEVITLSDKENRCPVTLEPITDLPPTQLFATNEAFTARSTSSSTSSRSNISCAIKTCSFAAPTAVPPSLTAENKKNSKLLPNLDPDDEDDLLTQAFLLPSSSNAINSTKKNVAAKCFNSTLLNENKALDKNPANFFAEMEETHLKQTTTFLSASNALKVPDKELSAVKKTSSATSTTSDSDLDLLMCTPQLIKEHIQVNVKDDLRKNILAAKNKNLFGDDTDEEETNDGSTDLVKLINVPKDFKDFDKLLPHLKSVKEQPAKENEQKKAAKEAQKEYKFNISFGKEQEEAQQSSTSKSTKSGRDERHMARDRERELAERKGKMKSNERKDNKKNNTVKDNDPEKQERQATRNRKTLTATDKFVGTKQEESKKENSKVSSGEDSKEKSVESHTENTKKAKERTRGAKKSIEKDKSNSTKEEKDQKKSLKETKSDQTEKQKPSRRMTRSKSIHEDNAASTSKEALNKTKTKESHQSKIYAEDDMDSVSTQPFVRITRRLNSKNSEDSTTTTKLANNTSRNEASSTENTSINDSIKKTSLNERKRKTEPPPAIAERKRLRSTHSQDSSSSTHSSSVFCISMTMVDPELFKEFVKKSNGVWHIATDPAESQILVMDKAFRTFKFLLAMARGIPIVTSEYLRKVNELQSIRKVRVTDYLFSDAEFEKKHKFTLVKSLQMAKRQKIFKDYEFLMTPNIQPNPSEIKAIIETAGGLVYNKSPPESKEGQQLYLVSSVEDKKEWHKYRRLNKNITIISTEAIMSSVMRQTTARMSSYTLA